MAKLKLIPAGGGSAREITSDVTLGRDPACEVMINDGSISRKHARIERRGEAWAVVDQASANGTFIDGQRVSDAGLRSGHELKLGSISFRVEVEEEAFESGATIVQTVHMPTFDAEKRSPAPAQAPPSHPPAPAPAPPRPPVAAPPPPPPPPPVRHAVVAPPRPAVPPSGGAYAPAPAPPAGGGAKKLIPWVLGGCGCLLILFGFAAVVLMLTMESCGSSQQGGGAPAAGAPGAGAPAQPAARKAAALTIEEESVTAAAKDGGAAVEFSYAARGFTTQATGAGHRVRLQADIETYGPDGQLVSSLSKKGFQQVDELAADEPGGWRFSGTLTLAPGAPSGNYVLKIRISDRNSGGVGERSSRFSLE